MRVAADVAVLAAGDHVDGVLVADFSRVLAGPLATITLADLGATVIKVERPGSGDDTRAWGPPRTTHASSYFECVNRSKRSVVLDLADPDDRAKAQELAAEIADAVPSVEQVRLVSSGTEAAMSALRLARAFTSRNRVIKFAGGYHGHGDAFLAEHHLWHIVTG